MIFIYLFLFFLYLQLTKNRKRSACKNHETQWTHKQAKHKKLKSLKKDEYTCNKQNWKAIEILLLMLLNIPIIQTKPLILM